MLEIFSKKGSNNMKKLNALLLALVAPVTLAQAPQDFSAVQVVPHKLTENLYYLEGSGGNIGVSVGEDGVFLIDDQYAPLTEKIIAAVKSISDEPIRFVFNTHHHGDHTGGNQNMGNSGVIIIAHENVRTNLSKAFNGGDLTKALTADQSVSLPVITFADTVDLHLNGHDIHAQHLAPAHTDGDSIVVFKDVNIIHTGDVFRTTSYPRADAAANGKFFGIIEAYETLLAISDANTVFLPGHGVLSKRSDVESQLAMLNTISSRVKAAKDAGQTLEQIQAAKPTAEFDAVWSGGNTNAGSDLVAVIFNELNAQ